MVDRTRFPQWLRKAQALTYLDEVWQLKYATGTFGTLCSLGLGPDAHYRGRVQVFSPESLDAFARTRVRGPVATDYEVRTERVLHPGALAEMRPAA